MFKGKIYPILIDRVILLYHFIFRKAIEKALTKKARAKRNKMYLKRQENKFSL